MFRRHLAKAATRLILHLACFCILAGAPLVHAASWNIDPDRSSVKFKVSYMKVSDIEGRFDRFKGAVTLDDRDVTRSRVRITIDAASLSTGVTARDEELRSPNFLDTARYPTITFVSRKVEKAGDGKLRVRGDLTAHGVTRRVVLNVVGPGAASRDTQGGVRRKASATAQIKRKDFNLTWNRGGEAGDGLIGDEVAILLEIAMVRGK